MHRRWSLFALALLLTGGCRRPDRSVPDDHAAAIPVQTTTVVAASAPWSQPVPGTVRPFAHAIVAAKITGTVTTASLAVGRTVEAGEILVTVQAGELGARVDEARAALSQAEREYERERALETKGASTADAMRTADDHRQQVRATLQEAEAMLSYTRIPAPFSGVLTADFVKPGDLATPGRPLFELEGTDRLRAEAQVPESLPLPALGTELEVEAGNNPISGRLAELSPAADPISRTRLAKLDLPAAAPVRSGQFVRILWPAGSHPVLRVPATAVRVFGQMERVYVITAGRACLRLVKTGAREGRLVEVSAGLDAGETVVTAPSATLADGQPVEISP